MNVKIIIFAAVLSVFIAGCTQQQQQPSAESQTSTNAAAESSARLEVSIEPQQPKSGKEAKLVAELRDANGNPISDVEVKTTAVMKMGDMGDMRESATLKWTGSRYEGAIKASMAGEWEVTVEAMKDGKVIATQKTKMKVE
jgi:hypothetical protein